MSKSFTVGALTLVAAATGVHRQGHRTGGDGMTAYTGYIAGTFVQLDDPRQEALSAYAASLLAEQRAEELVRNHGALTMEQLEGMTLGDLERHAREVGASASAVMRVAEAYA